MQTERTMTVLCRGNDPWRRQEGITLIELMVVVVIVAILASIGYPSYREHVIKTRRAEAKAALADAAAREEQFYLDNKTYTPTIGVGGLNASATTEHGDYTVAVAAPTAACPISRCYALTATPLGAQADDTRCGTMRLNSSGQKLPTTTGCW